MEESIRDRIDDDASSVSDNPPEDIEQNDGWGSVDTGF